MRAELGNKPAVRDHRRTLVRDMDWPLISREATKGVKGSATYFLFPCRETGDMAFSAMGSKAVKLRMNICFPLCTWQPILTGRLWVRHWALPKGIVAVRPRGAPRDTRALPPQRRKER